MYIDSSPFYNLPYHFLAKYLMYCQNSKGDKTLYKLEHHQEAINILLDRLERAQSNFDRLAFDKLIHAPIRVGDQRGFVQSIINLPQENTFKVRVWLPELNSEIDIDHSTSFRFDVERMPSRSVHTKVNKTSKT